MFKSILAFIIPPLGIPLKIISSIKTWRPSVKDIALIIATVLIFVQYVTISGFHIKPHIGPIKFTLISITGLREENRKLKSDINKLETTRNIVREAQIVINKQPAIDSRTFAEKVNEQSETSSTKINEALNKYIASHPVTKCTSKLRSKEDLLNGKADLSRSDNTTQGGNEGDVVADMVAIRREELQGFTANTKDLGELRAYIKAMIEAGWFVPWSAEKPSEDISKPVP